MRPSQKALSLARSAIVLVALARCAGTPSVETGVSGSYVAPTDPNIETVVLLGTNDIHGALGPMQLKTSDGVAYEKGGLAHLASHVRLLRAQYGNRLLLMDAGDQFQGSIESNTRKGEPMVQVFNAMGVTAAAVGNHEFDFGQGSLKSRMSEARYPYLAANILDKSTQKSARFPNTLPHLLVQAGRVKVGIIGLSTQDTPVTTIPTHVSDLGFGELAEAAQRESIALRSQGAQIVIIVAHAGLRCEAPGIARNQLHKPQDGTAECDPQGEIVQVLRKLKPGTVDAVVSGHSHTIVHHWVHGVPVIQSGSRGHQFHLVYLQYDTRKNRLLTEETRIEGPVPVCPKIFKNQGDCNGDRPAPKMGRGALVTPRFRGEEIEEDPQIAAMLAPVFKASEDVKNKVVGHAARRIEHTRQAESPMGNLVTDAMRDSVKADFALMNAGGIRAGLEAGPIRYGDVFQALPFENAVSLLNVTGRELKRILQVAEGGARGFFPFSGLQLKVVDLKHTVSGIDLNKDGRIEPWELTRLIEARTAAGDPIEDDEEYKLAVVDFLVLGGDDMGWAMDQIPRKRVQITAGPVLRDALLQWLAAHDPLNSEQAPLVQPDSPRLILAAAPPKSSKKGRRARKRKRRD